MAPFERNLPRFPPSFAKPLKGIPQIYTAKRKCEDAWLPIMAKWEETQEGWGGESRGGYRGKSEGQDNQNETKTDRQDQWQFVGGIGSHKPVFNDPRETNQNFTSQHFDGNKLRNGYQIMETKERYE